ncbi:hypothetical protein C4D60_Mb01t23260 [Musa balbisiana]|uniref:Uncharacterized protein n=1 Tax=Musa balbisiana TaxID=52838 RepID=A0A4S8JQN2_MUSBA|nr:hypothetical protein C4D60_Mb01t23260 [Musa balbisiana]
MPAPITATRIASGRAATRSLGDPLGEVRHRSVFCLAAKKWITVDVDLIDMKLGHARINKIILLDSPVLCQRHVVLPTQNAPRFIGGRGLKVFILSSRAEYLREATVENLIAVGYHGWTDLILRSEEDKYTCAEEYKAKQRSKLVHEGYRLWGIVGSQWSSLGVTPRGGRPSRPRVGYGPTGRQLTSSPEGCSIQCWRSSSTALLPWC